MVAVATELTQDDQELSMAIETTSPSAVASYSGSVLKSRQRAAAEFLAWAEHHAHDVLRQKAKAKRAKAEAEQAELELMQAEESASLKSFKTPDSNRSRSEN